MKNKKASHVGVVLSFVIFVTFLVFLFSILGSPIKLPSNKDASLDYLEIRLADKFSSNLTILTISPINSGNKNCIEINNLLYGFQNLNSLVKNKSDNIIGSTPNKGSSLYINWLAREEFFKIFYSEDILKNLEFSQDASCHLLLSSEINSLRENKYFNVAKINDFFSTYESDYDSLKTEFNLPQNTEFGLSFTDAEGITTTTGEVDSSINIYSREVPIQYFNETASINSGFINIKVW